MYSCAPWSKGKRAESPPDTEPKGKKEKKESKGTSNQGMKTSTERKMERHWS